MTLRLDIRTMSERQEAEVLFLQNLVHVERIVASLCRRYKLEGDAADDFGSWVKLKLIEHDYAVFKKFRGDAAVTTYLTVVIAMLFRDYRAEHWGRWRPSAAARRLGAVATSLEYLVYCQGYRLDQAGEELRTLGKTELGDRQLAELLAKLPPRRLPRSDETGSEPLDGIPAASSSDDLVEAGEAERSRRAAYDLLHAAIGRLSSEEQVIVRLRIWQEMSVADIARALNVPQMPLYRTLNRIFARLRADLQASGLSVESMRDLLDDQHP